MAVLYISEYAKLGYAGNAIAQTAAGLPIAEQHVAIGGTSAPSAATNANTRLVQLNCDTACCLAFAVDSTPTAVTTAHRMSAGETRLYVLPPGTIIAVIAASA